VALNARQKIFVAEYIKSRNGAKAARAAGYAKKSSHVTGAQLLANPSIRKAVDKGLEHLIKRADITAEKVLNSIASIAFAGEKKVRHSDKLKANELLGKHLKLFTEVQESTVSASVSVVDPAEVAKQVDECEKDC
jgi:phage terminase small subunit